jgi:hypothetical protein
MDQASSIQDEEMLCAMHPVVVARFPGSGWVVSMIRVLTRGVYLMHENRYFRRAAHKGMNAVRVAGYASFSENAPCPFLPMIGTRHV